MLGKLNGNANASGVTMSNYSGTCRNWGLGDGLIKMTPPHFLEFTITQIFVYANQNW